jgi:replication factor C subunit 3/5
MLNIIIQKMDEILDEEIIIKKKPNKPKSNPMELYEQTMDWMNQFKESYVEESNKKNTKNLPWVEKYRPISLDNIIGHEKIIQSLKSFVRSKQLPHLLFTGPPGNGKTSTIKACARELYGSNYRIMVLEINASEERGIEVVRNKIKDFIITRGVFLSDDSSLFKMVILDEADAMTSDAQAMLRSVIEKYTENVRFCLICNYIKKIHPAIQSRCVVYKFKPIKKKFIQQKINSIVSDSGLDIEKDGIDMIVKIAKGDMRKIMNILQSTSMSYDIIDCASITNCVGYPQPSDINQIIKKLLKSDYTDCYQTIYCMITTKGYSLSDILIEITDYLINKSEKISNQNILLNILIKLKEIELNLTICSNDIIQLAGLVGAFKLHIPAEFA